MTGHRKAKGPFRLASFNMYVGNSAPTKNLGRVVKATGHPVAIVVQEASKWQGKVDGYRSIRATNDENPNLHTQVSQQDMHSSIVLLRDDCRLIKVEARQVPNGAWSWNKPRVGRVWVRVVYELDGVIREVWCVHRCPGGPNPGIVQNRGAWKAEQAFLLEWVGRVHGNHPERPIDLGGDWNTWLGKFAKHPQSVENLARALGARMHLKHIDGFLCIRPDTVGRPKNAKVKKLARKFGSDGHRPVVVTLP